MPFYLWENFVRNFPEVIVSGVFWEGHVRDIMFFQSGIHYEIKVQFPLGSVNWVSCRLQGTI